MEIIEFIKEDHVKVSRLLEEIAKTSDKDVRVREELFPKLCSLLRAHSSAEEETLYNPAEKRDELTALISDSFDGHQEISDAMNSLEAMDYDEAGWLDQFLILKESVVDHKTFEEAQVLPICERVFSQTAREGMYEQMQGLEKEIMAAEDKVSQKQDRTIAGIRL